MHRGDWRVVRLGRSAPTVLNDSPVASKVAFDAGPGDVLTVTTPGGGGWGQPA